jgi:acyl carrier protein
MAVEFESIVREAAASLGMLDPSGELKPLDSIAGIDLVVEIENRAKIEIPAEVLRADAFQSIATIAQMLRSLK